MLCFSPLMSLFFVFTLESLLSSELGDLIGEDELQLDAENDIYVSSDDSALRRV